MGAPVGNQNAAKAKVWASAIKRAIEQKSAVDRKDALDGLAAKLIDLCMQGDLAALKELGDRLDGKPAQSMDIGGPDGTPVRLVIING